MPNIGVEEKMAELRDDKGREYWAKNKDSVPDFAESWEASWNACQGVLLVEIETEQWKVLNLEKENQTLKKSLEVATEIHQIQLSASLKISNELINS